MDLQRGSVDQLTNPQSHDQVNPTEVCWCGGATNLREVKCVQDLMPLFRSSVREEVEDVIKQLVLPHLPSQQAPALPARSPANLAESSASSNLQLHFVGTLPDTLFTFDNIKVEGGSVPMVELRNSLGSRVEVGPEASAKIQIVALDGDFEVEDRDHWTNEDFNEHVLSPRNGKRPLLVDKCEISLSKGVRSVGDISFTDNSKWTRSGKFRLGAHVVKGVPSGIKAAVSGAFRVKERRLKACAKHKTPALEDKLWRLDNIAKDGPICRRLEDANIHTLKDFLQLYHTNAKRLKEILHVAEKKWLEIVKNAESCSLTNVHYGYNDDAIGVELLLDCVFNIVSISFRGQNSQPYGSLDDVNKEFANNLREIAYEKRSELKTYASTNQALTQPQPIYPSGILWTNMQYTDAQATDQGKQVSQGNSYLPSLPSDALRWEDGHQLEAPISHICDLDAFFGPYPEDIWNSAILPEEGGNYFEASTDDSVTSKLKGVCCVTKAAVMFMISIQQDSSAPKKKQKVR